MARHVALTMALVAAGCTSTTDAPPTPSSTAAPTTTPPAPTSTTAVPVVVSTTSPRLTAPPVTGAPDAGGVVDQGEGMPGQATAKASWYARGSHTASGEAFDPDGLTYAHLSDAYGTMTRFCHGGRCVVARCNDRGPARWTGRTFDLSRGAFSVIAPLGAGVVEVTWEAT